MNREIKPVVIDEESPTTKRLAWWLENSFVRIVQRLFNSLVNPLRELFSFSITDFIEDYEKDLIIIAQPFFDQILASPDIPDFIKAPIRKALTGTNQAGLAILAIIVPILAMALGVGLQAPVGRIVESVFDQILRSRLLDPGTLVLLWQRGLLLEGELNILLAKNGLNRTAIEALKDLSVVLVDERLLGQMELRGEIPSSLSDDQLRKRGLSETHIQLWRKSLEIIPGVGDLVSMAVREAFQDDVAARFGYDENFPTEAAEWGEKQGLSTEWFKRYWRAHWTLPGLTQVREMYQRRIINENDLDSYLIAADIPIFWRTALKEWFYREITRVDVRRIYDLGLLTPLEVSLRYTALGYSSEDAILMTQWTIANYQDETRQLTKSNILAMYKDGILRDTESKELLIALGFQTYDIELLLAHQDLKREQEFESKIISNVKKLYVAGQFDRTDVHVELGKLDTPGVFIEQSLQVWDLEIKAKVRIPSVTQLRDMAKKEVISREEFQLELINKGYSRKYIQWYVELWLLED